MRMIMGVFAALSVGFLSQAFATDPPAAEAAKSTTPASASSSVDSSATSTPATTQPAAASNTTTTATSADGTKQVRMVVGDAAAAARLQKLRAAGYKPEAHGEEVVFCRREPVLGTKFEHKVCNTAEQLESMTSTSRDEVEQMQRTGMMGNPTGH